MTRMMNTKLTIKSAKHTRLSDLIAEPLAIDLRYVPQLVGDIKAEQSASRTDDREPEPLSFHFDRKGQQLAEQYDASGQRNGTVTAIVPLTGVVVRHSYWKAGTAMLGSHLAKLDADPAIGSIILDVNSPGGSVYGTEELADIVRGIRERGQTHISAVVDPLMASAATWIATATSEVAAIPSADVGSIGVISIYADMSRMYADAGIDVSVIRTPDKKARFTGIEPLSDDMRDHIKARNADAYDRFVAGMMVNRKVDRETVLSKFGGGEVMRATEGVAAGLIDRIASLDQVIQERIAASDQPDDRVAKNRRRMAAVLAG